MDYMRIYFSGQFVVHHFINIKTKTRIHKNIYCMVGWRRKKLVSLEEKLLLHIKLSLGVWKYPAIQNFKVNILHKFDTERFYVYFTQANIKYLK